MPCALCGKWMFRMLFRIGFVSILDRKVSMARGLMCDAHSPKCYVLGWCDVMVAAVACVFHSISFGWILFVCLAVKHYHHRHRNHYYCYYLCCCCCCCCFVAKGHKHTLNCFKLQTIHSKLRMNRCEKESVKKISCVLCDFFFSTSLLLLFSIWYLTCCTLAMSTSFSQRACLTLWNALSRLKKKQRNIRISIINSTRATQKNKMNATIGIQKSNKQLTTKENHSN